MDVSKYKVGQRFRKRHQDNPALILSWELYYQGMMVQTKKGPLIENYLEKLLYVMNQGRKECSRIFAVRIDLHFPVNGNMECENNSNAYISNYISFLQWELEVANTKYPPKLRYVWCREQVDSIYPHYHLLLLLNGQAYRSLGRFNYELDNLFHRLVRAWSAAIGWPVERTYGLVNVAKDYESGRPYTWDFKRDDQAAFENLFYGASYMCKAYTKPIGKGGHCFDGSRF